MNYEEQPKASETRDYLDRYLDRALSAYSSTEPRSGLEQRVLAHIQSVPASHPWWIWLAVPALAILVVLVILSRRPVLPIQPAIAHNQTQTAPIRQSTTERPAEIAVRTNISPAHHRREYTAVAGNRHQKLLPRLPTFPSAQPLSRQEQLLVALVRNHREKLKEIVVWQREFAKTPEPEAQNPGQDQE